MISLEDVVSRLAKRYGPAKVPKTTDPLEMILLENVAYLAPDDRREAAFEMLRKRVGTKPEQILHAPAGVLLEICKLGGIHADLRSERLREIAKIAIDHFGGDLRPALKLPFKQALRELKRFPSIGEPGAEKILLFGGGACPILALESNGLRVLARVFFGGEQKSYSATYRAVREAAGDQSAKGCAWLTAAHQLLRRHGQECCTRNHPACGSCPLVASCRYTSLNS